MRHVTSSPARQEQPVTARLHHIEREAVKLAKMAGVQHFLRAAVRESPVAVQQQEPVAITACKQQVVDHHYHQRAVLAGLTRQALEHRYLMWQIEMLKRFVQQDPIGVAGGMNFYGYVGADPINNTDPSGLVCTYKTGDIYKVPGKYLVKEEDAGWVRHCGLHAKPTYGPPEPEDIPHRGQRGWRKFRFPLHFEFERICKYEWEVKSPAVYEERISYWMPQWYDCVDPCTGEGYKIYMKDQFIR